MSEPEHTKVDADLAFGEAFGMSLLLAGVLKELVRKGIFSAPEIVHIIDYALLDLEKLQGAPGSPKVAVARSRKTLGDFLKMFSGLHPKH